MNNILQLTTDNFQQILGEASQTKLVLIEFFSAQSPECQQQAPLLDSLISKYSEHAILARLNCDTEQALASQLAQQVGIQAIPTIIFLKNAAPVDMLAGPQNQEQLKLALEKHLPSADELLLEQAKHALAQGEMEQAFNAAKQAYQLNADSAAIKLVFADICLNIQKLADAEALLNSITMVDQDTYYTNLKAKLELALEAQDSPEIKELQDKVTAEPDNLEYKTKLAVQYNQVGRKEDALETLYAVLVKDMNFADSKKMFLDVIATLPDGDPLANTYRRKLYSMLY